MANTLSLLGLGTVGAIAVASKERGDTVCDALEDLGVGIFVFGETTSGSGWGFGKELIVCAMLVSAAGCTSWWIEAQEAQETRDMVWSGMAYSLDRLYSKYL